MPQPMPLLPPVTSTVRAVGGVDGENGFEAGVEAGLSVTEVTLPSGCAVPAEAYAEEVAGTMTNKASRGNSRSAGYTRQNFSVITDARTATSEEHAGRVKRYAITMAFRTACFIGMIFAPGVWRWVLFACAVFLPYIAVLLANQAHQRGIDQLTSRRRPRTAPRQLTTGPEEPGVISGARSTTRPRTAARAAHHVRFS